MRFNRLFKIIFSFFIFVFIINQTALSQVKMSSSNWKSPFFTLELAGSFNLPVGDAGGNISDFFTFQKYGTNLGWGGQFNLKFGLGQKGAWRPY